MPLCPGPLRVRTQDLPSRCCSARCMILNPRSRRRSSPQPSPKDSPMAEPLDGSERRPQGGSCAAPCEVFESWDALLGALAEARCRPLAPA